MGRPKEVEQLLTDIQHNIYATEGTYPESRFVEPLVRYILQLEVENKTLIETNHSLALMKSVVEPIKEELDIVVMPTAYKESK